MASTKISSSSGVVSLNFHRCAAETYFFHVTLFASYIDYELLFSVAGLAFTNTTRTIESRFACHYFFLRRVALFVLLLYLKERGDLPEAFAARAFAL